MKIIFYDGSVMLAREIEFGDKNIIINGYYVVPTIEVLRIVAG